MSTPNLDRMSAVKAESQVIGEFLEWLVAPDDANGAGGKVQVELRVQRGTRECAMRRTANANAVGVTGREVHCESGEVHDEAGFTCSYCITCKGTGRKPHYQWLSVDLGDDPDRIELLLAEYFGVNIYEAEQERYALLEDLQAAM